MEFWPIFDSFHWLRPYLCSKRGYLGFHKQATHRRHDDEPFFTLGSTVHDWGWPKNGPFWTKKGQTWQACQHSKVVQKGPKGTNIVNLNVFDHLVSHSLAQVWSRPEMEFVQNFTPPDFEANNFTPSISPNFNSFSKKKHKKWVKMEKGAGTFHSAGKSKEGSVGMALPNIRFSWHFYQIISGTKYE